MKRRTFLEYAIAVGYGLRKFGRNAITGTAAILSGEARAQPAKPKPTPVPPLRRDTAIDYAGMADNSWLQVTTGGFSSGIAAYSGFCIDDIHDQLLIFGGGHHDYAGNEVRSVDLLTGAQRMLTQPDNFQLTIDQAKA